MAQHEECQRGDGDDGQPPRSGRGRARALATLAAEAVVARAADRAERPRGPPGSSRPRRAARSRRGTRVRRSTRATRGSSRARRSPRSGRWALALDAALAVPRGQRARRRYSPAGQRMRTDVEKKAAPASVTSSAHSRARRLAISGTWQLTLKVLDVSSQSSRSTPHVASSRAPPRAGGGRARRRRSRRRRRRRRRRRPRRRPNRRRRRRRARAARRELADVVAVDRARAGIAAGRRRRAAR